MNEDTLEQAALAWLTGLGYETIDGRLIEPEGPQPERARFQDVLLEGRLRAALVRLNPTLHATQIDEIVRTLHRIDHPTLLANNQRFHRLLVEGVAIEERRSDGTIGTVVARLFDPDQPAQNAFLAVSQYTVIDIKKKRADIVLFVNGLPLVLIELKSPVKTSAGLPEAYRQLQTYKAQVPSLLVPNALLITSDGANARLGTITSDETRFAPWRTMEGEVEAPTGITALQVLLTGVCAPERLLDLIRHFIVFEQIGDGSVEKKVAGYHQYHAVNAAVSATVAATSPDGDRRCGVVWHTQGSGKSLTMVFYAARLAQHPALANPTIVMLTDRNDLDDQLFATFSRCDMLLRQRPVQAASRADLRQRLAVASGGIIFTTIQKFLDDTADTGAVSLRTNVVVLADEAHRSQYGFTSQVDVESGIETDGYAQHVRAALPNASYLGFTGTPVAAADRNTRQVFGDYISIYDIQRAVNDGATVPIYYENRVAQLDLDPAARPTIDEDFAEVTEGEETMRTDALKRRWTALEAIVGTERRIQLIAQDIVAHFAERTSQLQGKAMIVCMSRRICVELYDALIALRPEWHSDQDSAGVLKVIMTGASSDPLPWQPHIRNRDLREALGLRFRQADDPFQIVIVRDMWLTGFDAPSIHTMYVDKPMQGHNLMQAIARVNRVFRDKPGGLVVDYIGLADRLKEAVSTYSAGGGAGAVTVDQEAAVAVMQAKFEVCRDLFFGFDYREFLAGTPQQRVQLLPDAQEHIYEQPDGLARLVRAVRDLAQASALAMPHPAALAIRDDLAFFQSVRSWMLKTTATPIRTDDQLNHAVRQLVAQAIAPSGIIDVFAAAGLPKPDLSILSDAFLEDVRSMPQQNLAVELLARLLENDVRDPTKRSVVRARTFGERLEQAVNAYRNRALETTEILDELIALAREVRAADARGEATGLSPAELAFYEALEVNDSAVAVLGDETLRIIARELVRSVRKNATVDWTVRESVRARLRTEVRRTLRRYGYPPDRQERATETVLQQAELLSSEWAQA